MTYFTGWAQIRALHLVSPTPQTCSTGSPRIIARPWYDRLMVWRFAARGRPAVGVLSNWHTDYRPEQFLAKANIEKLLDWSEQRLEARDLGGPACCALCQKPSSSGVLLNDDRVVCRSCVSVLQRTAYPEQYERKRGDWLRRREARKLAWDAFHGAYEFKGEQDAFTAVAFGSLLLLVLGPSLVVVPGVLLGLEYIRHRVRQSHQAVWQSKRMDWEAQNPIPPEPALKHFHDTSAQLTARDRLVLDVFEHWPGDPPYWGYLRAVVLDRDRGRCQVSGCPSRLSLHVHHKQPRSQGGAHAPDNLVTLCDFHHALEPSPGHERIWGTVSNQFFSLVRGHSRSNSVSDGVHQVRPHLRRYQLATDADLLQVVAHYGLSCPACESRSLQLNTNRTRAKVAISCAECAETLEGPLQLAEETGPRIAEQLTCTQNEGAWTARWEMLDARQDGARVSWTRAAARKGQGRSSKPAARPRVSPKCPECGAGMRMVKPRQGQRWKAFWGCTRYKAGGCRGSLRVE